MDGEEVGVVRLRGREVEQRGAGDDEDGGVDEEGEGEERDGEFPDGEGEAGADCVEGGAIELRFFFGGERGDGGWAWTVVGGSFLRDQRICRCILKVVVPEAGFDEFGA